VDGIPDPEDICPFRFDPAQLDCNVDVEDYAEADRIGDRCDSHPCGETYVQPKEELDDSDPFHPIRKSLDRYIVIDALIANSTAPNLRTGVRFCICSAAEDDEPGDREICRAAQADGTGDCNTADHEDYDDPQPMVDSWRWMSIIHESPVPGTGFEFDGTWYGEDEAAVVYQRPAWGFRVSIEINWDIETDVIEYDYVAESGMNPMIDWAMHGVLWTHTPGPTDGGDFVGIDRTLASHYLSRGFGQDVRIAADEAEAGLKILGPGLVPTADCPTCGSAFPRPFLMIPPCLGLPGCTQISELRSAESTDDAIGLFHPGSHVGLGQVAGSWVVAAEPDERLSGAGPLRYAAVATNGTTVNALLNQLATGLQRVTPSNGGSPPSSRSSFGTAASAQLNRVWVIGGVNGSGGLLQDLRSFNPSTQTWTNHPLTSATKPAAVLAATYDPLMGKLVVLDVLSSTVRLLHVDPTGPTATVLASWPRTTTTNKFSIRTEPQGYGYMVACSTSTTHRLLHIKRDETGVGVAAYRQGSGTLSAAGLQVDRGGATVLVPGLGGLPFPYGHEFASFTVAGSSDASRCF